MADFHFVEDYVRFVDTLVATHPLEEAMSLAVGGGFAKYGQIEVDVLRHAGLKSGMALLDMGCGSGRLAHLLAKADLQLDYTGVDIVQKLLDYAATICPPDYRFILNRAMTWPVADGSIDMACGFSLFTHLLHHETYLYLEDLKRALRPGGKVVFSFLEFRAPSHWSTFVHTVEAFRATGDLAHLNMFIERNAIDEWARHLGYNVDFYIEPDEAVSPLGPLGQSTVVLSLK